MDGDGKEVEYGDGGHWNHDQLRLRLLCDMVAEDQDASTRWPVTCGLFGVLGEALWDVLESMDERLGGGGRSESEQTDEDAEWAGRVLAAVRMHMTSEGLETETPEEDKFDEGS
jgi:hypothetical protein